MIEIHVFNFSQILLDIQAKLCKAFWTYLPTIWKLISYVIEGF